MNSNKLAADYWIGIGPLPTTSGYGAGPFGSGAFGTGTATTSVNLGTPITATDWTLDNFGEYLVACPESGPVFTWGPRSTSSNLTMLPAGPIVNKGAFVAMPQRQIVAYGSTFYETQDPLLVRWCDIEDWSDWIGTAVNQAGSFRLSSGSKIVGGMQGAGRGLLWTDVGVWGDVLHRRPACVFVHRDGEGLRPDRQESRRAHDERRDLDVAEAVLSDVGRRHPAAALPGLGRRLPEPEHGLSRQDSLRRELAVQRDHVVLSVRQCDRERLLREIQRHVERMGLRHARPHRMDRSVILGSPVGAGSNNAIYQHETGYDATRRR
jgi:hypothetical protein